LKSRIQKTKIGWTDYTLNPIKGRCNGPCPYCYAKRMYDRFKWNPEIRFVPKELDKLEKIKKPSRIFLCSMHELFGNWISSRWINTILYTVGNYPQHAFQILTKCPERALHFHYPRNIWMGITITGEESRDRQKKMLASLREIDSRVRFISFEPLLAMPIDFGWEIANWFIVGAKTNLYLAPSKHWIECLIYYSKKTEIPIFLKNNLKPLLGDNLRQEFPR